ncbi:FMN reductase [Actinoplanes oblitus]|uniref:FMN reductase n=1 Tax=Actinoplanes oblitus TaxID=3040509 RepID=A0ABY8WML3_9ACTN|nr:FMN reductase [Actinoplanes oblitus]WIM99085.1 FMN reductase [Actinoplanes oblitus]
MKQRSLVVISSGLSQPSSTRLLADQLSAAAGRAAAQLGVTVDVQVVELRDLAHGITDHMLTGFPPAALKQAQDAVAAADGLIVVTPVFSAGYSGLFKSFFDVLEKDTLVDKPILLAATAGTARHSLVLEHALRPLFAYLRALPLPTAVFAASDDWGANSVEGPLRGRIERAAGELARELERRAPATVTDPFALTESFEDMLKSF